MPPEASEPSRRILSTAVGSEAVLMNQVSGRYYGLNEVGARIWCLLGEGKPVSEIVSLLVAEYDISAEALESDVRRFIAELGSRDLIDEPCA